MSGQTNLPPHVKYWLSSDSKHDCYFMVGPQPGLTERIGSFKAFLMGHSEPFRAMLQDSELTERGGDICIVDIQADTFRSFLECLYMNGENITLKSHSFQRCVDLLYVADKYLVTYIKEKLVKCLLSSLHSEVELEDVFTALSSPVFLNEEHLNAIFSKIVRSKIKKIFSSPSFMNISSESLLWILKLESVGTDEITLWQELLKWAIHNTGSKEGSVLRQFVLKHLNFIRFCVMSYNDFCGKVVPFDILTHTEVYNICKWMGLGKRPQQIPNMEFICNNMNVRKDIKEESGNVFSYCVNDISDLDEALRSPDFALHGLDWDIIINKNNGFLSVFLECISKKLLEDYDEGYGIELILISHSGNNLSLPLDFRKFCSANPKWGYRNFCSWDDIMSPSKDYVLYDSITIAVRMFKNETL